MLTEKYDFRITDQMTILLRPHWIANDSYREKCKMLVLNRSKYNATGFTENKHQGIRAITFISKSKPASQVTPTAVQLG